VGVLDICKLGDGVALVGFRRFHTGRHKERFDGLRDEGNLDDRRVPPKKPFSWFDLPRISDTLDDGETVINGSTVPNNKNQRLKRRREGLIQSFLVVVIVVVYTAADSVFDSGW
jgi:hypothetical protein